MLLRSWMYFPLITALCFCDVAVSTGKYLHENEVKRLSKTDGNQASVVNISVDLNGTGHYLLDQFISLTLDSGQIQTNWTGFDFGSPKLRSLAANLAPTDVRIGGTQADHVIFNPNVTEAQYEQDTGRRNNVASRLKDDDFYLTGTLWKTMSSFFRDVDWNVIFDLNAFRFKRLMWDTENAQEFLTYSSAKNILISGFQLGNEPDLYKGDNAISPATLVADYKELRNLISNYSKFSGLFGPEVTAISQDSASWRYLKWFLDSGGADVVDEIGVHHYYTNGRTARLADFLNVQLMDSLKEMLELLSNMSKSSSNPRPIRLSETSSCYNEGAPNLSDRYAAGFLWLDKLGVAALYNVTQVFRQDFWGYNYGLISASLDPNPDYFLTYLYKQLIFGNVIKVTISPAIPSLRVYAACGRLLHFPNGAIVLYYLNVGDTAATLYLDQFQGLDLDLYQLTPGDNQGLLSKFIALNGETLIMNGTKLPKIAPKIFQGNVVADAYSYGFIGIANGGVHACI